MTDWIDWHGGKCPVGPNVRVEVQLRDGCRDNTLPAREWIWDATGGRGDILRYRIIDVEPQGVRLTEAQFVALLSLVMGAGADYPRTHEAAIRAARIAFGLPPTKDPDHA